MIIEIDTNSGFCHGVVKAIKTAEEKLENKDKLFCLGDIVHNGKEVERLNKSGLISISKETFSKLKNSKVLLRAHGEPPEIYQQALKNNITIIDATCPVVLGLQKKIKRGYEEMLNVNGQVVIFGQEKHAEAIGLLGQTNNNGILINSKKDLDKIDYTRPILLYSQTTKEPEDYQEIIAEIEKRLRNKSVNLEQNFKAFKTICRHVSNRKPGLIKFCNNHDVIIFVSGRKSSNGKMLFDICKKENTRTYFVSDANDLEQNWLTDVQSIGITGATSTPGWLMEEIAARIKSFKN